MQISSVADCKNELLILLFGILKYILSYLFKF